MFSKPLISCEIGTGTTYINIDGETGIAIPPASSEHLAQAMQQLWNNEEQAQAYGQAARERFERLFQAKDMVARLCRYL